MVINLKCFTVINVYNLFLTNDFCSIFVPCAKLFWYQLKSFGFFHCADDSGPSIIGNRVSNDGCGRMAGEIFTKTNPNVNVNVNNGFFQKRYE